MTDNVQEQRIIIEMGTGNDLHGMDYTRACARAIEDAFRHSSLPLFGALEMSHDVMRVQRFPTSSTNISGRASAV